MQAGIAAAIGLALTAAVFHATWNVLLKASGNPLRLSAQAMGASTLLATPFAALAWLLSGHPRISAHTLLLAGLSAVLEVVYFVALSNAYERGELSAVYPLARGTAPLVAVLVGIVALGERPSPAEAAGIGLLLAGIWTVRPPGTAGAATAPALLTGVTIAAYSSVDSLGVRSAPPWLYGWLMWACSAVLLVLSVHAWTILRRPAEPHPPVAPDLGPWRAALVGVLMGVTYLLILFALRLAPLALVSPLRESAIVLVTIWGMWRLREREARGRRLIGAGAILAGITLVAL